MEPTPQPALRRHIGLIGLTLYGLGDILGAGIYGLVGKAAGQMGNAVWLAFLASMVAAGFTGLSYAAVGSRHPRAGGAAYVTARAFRLTGLAYLVGLATMASGLTSMATASRVFAGYLQGMLPGVSYDLLTVGFATVIAAIVLYGIRETIATNALCTVVEVSGLLLIIVFGVSFIGSVNYLDAVTVDNAAGVITPGLILGGAVLTFYSFIGFEDMLNVSEEVKNPVKVLPRALILAVVGASAIYITVSLIAVSVIPAAELAASKQPLVDVVRVAVPWFPPRLFSFIALFAVSNTALLNFVMASRLLYGMSRQRLLPAVLGRVHARTATPHVAILVLYVLLLALALSGDIAQLARATSILLLSCFVVVNTALLVLKRREPTPEGVFDVPTFVPVAGAVICLAMLSQARQPELITAGIILAVIGVLYLVLRPDPKAVEQME
jgi:APA family basic amino acid/polyamine antiporter